MCATLRHQKGTEAQYRFVLTIKYLELNPSPSSRAVGRIEGEGQLLNYQDTSPFAIHDVQCKHAAQNGSKDLVNSRMTG